MQLSLGGGATITINKGVGYKHNSKDKTVKLHDELQIITM